MLLGRLLALLIIHGLNTTMLKVYVDTEHAIYLGANQMVSVDPKRAARCRWCGAFESDDWRNDIFRKGLWCSKECYHAGHLRDYLFSSIVFLTFSVTIFPYMILFYINLGNEQGLLPTLFFVLVIIPLTVFSSIITYKSYTLRKKIMKFQE